MEIKRGTTEEKKVSKNNSVQNKVDVCATALGHPLTVIRKRRMLLFLTVSLYIPLLFAVYAIWPSNKAMGIYFIIWLVFLIFFTFHSALLRCPGCGNYFHMHGMTLLYLRKCLHCQIHINSDKINSKP